MDDTSHRANKLKDDTMMISDPMFQSPNSRLERMKEIEEKKKVESKKKAIQSFAKAHSRRKKKK